MVKFCENCKGIISFKKVKIWIPEKKVTNEQVKAYCMKCGILDELVDPSTYRWETVYDHTTDGQTIILDRKKQTLKLQKKLGIRTHGSACPNCKSFYFTPRRVVTRGDEAGKTFLHCLTCGYVFRRPIYIPHSP